MVQSIGVEGIFASRLKIPLGVALKYLFVCMLFFIETLRILIRLPMDFKFQFLLVVPEKFHVKARESACCGFRYIIHIRKKLDSFAAHFSQQFNSTISRTYLRKYMAFKVVKKVNPIVIIKKLTKPN